MSLIEHSWFIWDYQKLSFYVKNCTWKQSNLASMLISEIEEERIKREFRSSNPSTKPKKQNVESRFAKEALERVKNKRKHPVHNTISVSDFS